MLRAQEVNEEVALAEDANRHVEEENEALRQQLMRVQEQLQAIQAQPSPSASPQVGFAFPCPLTGTRIVMCLHMMKLVELYHAFTVGVLALFTHL